MKVYDVECRAVITLAAQDMREAALHGAAVIKDNPHLIYVRAVHERNFEPERMTKELTDFIRCQASSLSVADLDRLIADLPALRERFAKIPLQTYAHLPDQLEFLCLFVEERVSGRSRDLAEESVAEAGFALLYFQCATDLIPDSIPDMGLLDDAMIVSMVLRRQEHTFKGSSHAYMLSWPEPRFDVDQLLSVISPLRVTSFCSSLSIQPSA